MIDYYGHWGSYVDGIGRFARRQARTMATRLPVKLRLWPEQWVQTEALMEVANLLQVRNHYSHPMRVEVTTIILQEKLRKPPSLAKRSIVYTMFERDRVDQPLVDRLRDNAGQVWVPCRQNARVLLEQGMPEEKVRVVPFSYDKEEQGPTVVDVARRRFYTMGTWQLRKNHDVLIGAFLAAFTPNDDVTLLIKTRGGGSPTPEEVLDHWINRFGGKWSASEVRRRVQIVDGPVSHKQIQRMHAMHNIYVSASHGEGWEMPAFDAVLGGNTLVHVPFGATDDWAPDSSIRVPYSMGAIPAWFSNANGWPTDAKWAVCSVDALAEALQKATPCASVLADMSAYTVDSVARVMERNLGELL